MKWIITIEDPTDGKTFTSETDRIIEYIKNETQAKIIDIRGAGD